MQISRDEFRQRQGSQQDGVARGTAARGRRSRNVRGDAPCVYAAPGHGPSIDAPFYSNADIHTERTGLAESLCLSEVPRPVLVALIVLVALAIAAGLVLRAQLCSCGVTIPRHDDLSPDDARSVADTGDKVDNFVQAGSPAQEAVPEQAADPRDASNGRADTSVPVLVEGGGEPAENRIAVHVAGAVERPGVYELPDAARVKDAVDAAGGPAADADLDELNLAEHIRDGMKIRVPFVGEQAEVSIGEQETPASTSSATPALVNINTADISQLETLPGIGPSTAQAIVDERASGGPFSAPEDLLRVSGIGNKKFAKLQGLICV